MKETLSIIFFVTAIFWESTAYSAQRQPSFFIPQKVLDKMNQPEKLPPIQPINHENRQTQINNNNRAKPSSTQLSAEQKRLTEQSAQQARIEKEKLLQAELERIKNSPNKPSVNSAGPEFTSPSPQSNPTTGKTEEIPTLLSETAQSVPQTEQPSNATVQLNNSQRTFDDIIADYEHDALGISQGKPINNPRLRDVLQDYSDELHVL